jgi:hypothetical protein
MQACAPLLLPPLLLSMRAVAAAKLLLPPLPSLLPRRHSSRESEREQKLLPPSPLMLPRCHFSAFASACPFPSVA